MLYLEQENNQIGKDKQLSFLVSGSDASLVPEKIKWASAKKVSQALSDYPNTMLQFTPDQLVDSIDEGRVVMAFGKGMKMVGFAQFWQYGFNEDGQQIFEFGSWLSFGKGCGEKVLKGAIRLGKKINPKSQLIAIVKKENAKAQSILIKVGAKEIGSKFSPAVRTVEGEAAFMKIFDITNLDSIDRVEIGNKEIVSNKFSVEEKILADIMKGGRI